jgi:hypothetical protein
MLKHISGGYSAAFHAIFVHTTFLYCVTVFDKDPLYLKALAEDVQPLSTSKCRKNQP